MRVEIVSPCCLHLGFVRGLDRSLCELTLALQHPPIQLTAQPAQQLLVSGARAGVAYRAAEDYFAHLGRPPGGQIEVELAIPTFMGLGADEMLGLSVTRALAHLSGAPDLPATYPVVRSAFERGGLALCDERGRPLQHARIAHADEEDDWVFVLVLPQAPDDIPDDFEARRYAALRDAAVRLDRSRTADALFDAVERNDFDAFAGALADLQASNEAALASNGQTIALDDREQDILAQMRAGGAALACRALTGLGLIGLIRGGPASRALRQKLVRHLGYFGPLVMASICDNQGAKLVTYER